MTSNLSFATDICADAALYFDPLDENDIFKKIKVLINNPTLYSELQIKGQERLKEFGIARDRAEAYLRICKEIVKKDNIIKNKSP